MTSSNQQDGEGWTKITLTAGNTTISAVLNHSRASKELISWLPFTVGLQRLADAIVEDVINIVGCGEESV